MGERAARIAQLVQRADGHPRVGAAMQALRRRLPGDDRYGDPLSLGRDAPPGLLGERLSASAAASSRA